MKTILVPIDFQPASQRALRYIENVFQKLPVEVHLVNVIQNNDPSTDQDIQEAFNKFQSEVLNDYPLAYRFSIIQGSLLEEIQRAIHFYKPFLVVIGTSGRTLTKAFIKLTDCPVMIVPENNTRSSISNIAYANDFNAVKVSAAFQPLLDLSQTFHAKVHIVHLNRDEFAEPDNAEASIEYYLQQVDHEYATVLSDNFITALQDYIRNEGIDVLTVLLRDHGGNETKSAGKLIEELVTNTNIPVLSLV